MDSPQESFEDFKNSFSYGSRTDMNFKFLKGLSEHDAAQFLQELLWKLSDTLDDGNLDRLAEHVIAGQQRGYAARGSFAYDDAPFTPLSKPLSEARIGLIASSGHFVVGDDPTPLGVANMTQDQAMNCIDEFLKAAPDLSAIPVDTPPEKLRVRHGGYDIRGAMHDPNVNLPIERLRELEAEGVIGELSPTAYSFVGAASQLRLQKESLPEWGTLCQEHGMDGLVLVPV